MAVYFAQARADTATVKIGFTEDIVKRQQNMSVSTPGGVAILASLPGNRDTEEYLHDKFSAHRLGGEWFRFSEEIRDFIRDIQNGKQGLIPFRDEAIYMTRSTPEFANDALARARDMATAIIAAEMRGIHDTIGAAKDRIEKRYGFSASMLHRLLYRDMRDVTAGVYFHLVEIHNHLCLNAKPGTSKSHAVVQSHPSSLGGVAVASEGAKRRTK